MHHALRPHSLLNPPPSKRPGPLTGYHPLSFVSSFEAAALNQVPSCRAHVFLRSNASAATSGAANASAAGAALDSGSSGAASGAGALAIRVTIHSFSVGAGQKSAASNANETFSLAASMRALNHSGAEIDVLRVDVQSSRDFALLRQLVEEGKGSTVRHVRILRLYIALPASAGASGNATGDNGSAAGGATGGRNAGSSAAAKGSGGSDAYEGITAVTVDVLLKNLHDAGFAIAAKSVRSAAAMPNGQSGDGKPAGNVLVHLTLVRLSRGIFATSVDANGLFSKFQGIYDHKVRCQLLSCVPRQRQL